MNRTSPDSERPPASEPVWERPWSVEEIRRSSQNWSLAADAGVSAGPWAQGGPELRVPCSLGEGHLPVLKAQSQTPGRDGPAQHSAAQTRVSFRAETFQPCPPQHPAVQYCLCPVQALLSLRRRFCIGTGLNGATDILE